MTKSKSDSLKQKLIHGRNIYGTCITSDAPLWPKVVASSKLDFVFLDTEHIPLTRSQLARMCQSYLVLGLSPIVRIPSPDPYRASQAIDDGAVGVIAPYLEHPDQIKKLVGAVKYRPLKGDKLNAILQGGTKLTHELKSYLDEYNFGNLCFANIESLPAVERLDKILNIEGLDGVFIGPHDLSINMGIPEQYDHPDFIITVKLIIEKARKSTLGVGIHFSEDPQRQIDWMKEGVNVIIHSSDMALFGQQLLHDIEKIRSSADDIQMPASQNDSFQI